MSLTVCPFCKNDTGHEIDCVVSRMEKKLLEYGRDKKFGNIQIKFQAGIPGQIGSLITEKL